MFRKAIILVSILMLCLTAACSSQTASGGTPSAASLTPTADSTAMTVNDKLGVGILSLDGTDLAVTTDQAAVLLPLWQAVQSLGQDKSAASAEISALYAQIQETLTADQIARIEQMNWSQTELTGLLQQVQPQTSQVSSTARSSTTSSSQGQNTGGGPGGDMLPPDGGIMLGGGAGAGMAAGQNTTGETQQSLILSQTSDKSSVELNVLFANAVINLLQQQVEL